ncbi:MAG: IclR family transcriptional regulator, partial [Pararhizobium sp.]
MDQSQRRERDNDPAPAASEFSLTVSRALGILSMFSPSRPQLSLVEISRESKLSKPSVLRFMQALLIHGYVEQDPNTKKYRPGYETFRVGSLVGGYGLRTTALPIMRAITEKLGFTTYLSILRSDKMLVLLSVEGKGPLRYTVPVGEVLPLTSTSAGQAALSVFDDAEIADILKDSKFERQTRVAPGSMSELLERVRQVRMHGYALSWEMTSPGVGSVASPAIGGDDTLVAVLSLGFGTGQVDRTQVGELGRNIAQAAEDLSAVLRNS